MLKNWLDKSLFLSFLISLLNLAFMTTFLITILFRNIVSIIELHKVLFYLWHSAITASIISFIICIFYLIKRPFITRKAAYYLIVSAVSISQIIPLLVLR
jgi:hypothetical protein